MTETPKLLHPKLCTETGAISSLLCPQPLLLSQSEPSPPVPSGRMDRRSHYMSQISSLDGGLSLLQVIPPSRMSPQP